MEGLNSAGEWQTGSAATTEMWPLKRHNYALLDGEPTQTLLVVTEPPNRHKL